MRTLETPRTPAQSYAVIASLFLLALGVLSLIFASHTFATVGGTTPGDFLIWNTTGWTALMWIVLGVAGLVAMARVDMARAFALAGGLFFAVIAIWGFIDGSEVFTLFVANPVNNITHAVLGGLGLMVGLPSESTQRAAAPRAPRAHDAISGSPHAGGRV